MRIALGDYLTRSSGHNRAASPGEMTIVLWALAGGKQFAARRTG
jgi:hypothetical protein